RRGVAAAARDIAENGWETVESITGSWMTIRAKQAVQRVRRSVIQHRQAIQNRARDMRGRIRQGEQRSLVEGGAEIGRRELAVGAYMQIETEQILQIHRPGQAAQP